MASSPIPASPLRRQRPSLRAILLSSLAVLILSMAAISVYFSSFTGFSNWDDEGYVMVGLRSFLQGKVLYDDVYSQYGPFYYLVEASLYSALHIPVTHDSVRAIAGFLWLLSAVLCSWSVYRLTRSWILAGLGFTGAIKLLSFFTLSPGHPEEVCIGLLTGLLVCACYLEDRPTVWKASLLGALIAALALTKINIGCYAALAIGLAFLKAAHSGSKQKAVFAGLSAAGLSLPLIILAPLLHLDWAQRAGVLVVLSIGAAILVAWYSETELFVTPPLWIGYVLTGGIVTVLVIATFLARGTTLSAMLYMTLIQHKDTAKYWYIPLHVQSDLVALLSLLLAAAWVKLSSGPRARGPMILALNVLKILVSLVCFFSLRTAGWSTMYSFAVPFAWLILVPASNDGSAKPPFARVALCLLTVFTALYPLPVAGAQVAFSVVLTIPMVCVFVADASSMLVALARFGWMVRQVATIAAVVVLAAANAAFLFWTVHNYRGLKPLSLAGAERIRVDAAKAADYRWITATLKQSCDSNFSMPGIYSLYFWTNTEPPAELLAGNWMGLLNEDQQQHVVNDLSRHARLCIVYNPRLVLFWRRDQDLSVSPLARYIQDNFAASAQRDGYIILVRNDHIRR
jgi:hypothetical protein